MESSQRCAGKCRWVLFCPEYRDENLETSNYIFLLVQLQIWTSNWYVNTDFIIMLFLIVLTVTFLLDNQLWLCLTCIWRIIQISQVSVSLKYCGVYKTVTTYLFSLPYSRHKREHPRYEICSMLIPGCTVIKAIKAVCKFLLQHEFSFPVFFNYICKYKCPLFDCCT